MLDDISVAWCWSTVMVRSGCGVVGEYVYFCGVVAVVVGVSAFCGGVGVGAGFGAIGVVASFVISSSSSFLK